MNTQTRFVDLYPLQILLTLLLFAACQPMALVQLKLCSHANPTQDDYARRCTSSPCFVLASRLVYMNHKKSPCDNGWPPWRNRCLCVWVEVIQVINDKETSVSTEMFSHNDSQSVLTSGRAFRFKQFYTAHTNLTFYSST